MTHPYNCECTDCLLAHDREDDAADERHYEQACEAEREQEQPPRPRTL